MPSVPSLPTNNLLISYPADDFLALVPVLIILPSAKTTSIWRTFSRIVPYNTAVVPDALVAAIPPNVAFAPGSTEKNNPVVRSSLFKASRVTPGCTTANISWEFTSNMRFISDIFKVIPPCNGSAWPSNEVPTPQGVIGQ